MILQKDTDEIVISNVDNSEPLIGLKINADIGHILQLVTKDLYKYPIQSVCREIISNCYDANKEAGYSEEENKILIKISDKSISFIDKGLGMSPDFIDKVYSSYFTSTKKTSNEFIGGFGLGSKSPLAYNSYFYINTVSNGVRYNYLFDKNDIETGIAAIRLLDSYETEEESGTEIVVEFVNKIDKFTFQKSVDNISLLLFKNNIVLHIEEVLVESKPINILEYENFYLINTNENSKTDNERVCLSLGKVIYEIKPKDYLSQYANLSTAITKVEEWLGVNGKGIVLKFNVGDLNPSLPREEINISESNNKNIATKVNLALHEFFLNFFSLLDFLGYEVIKGEESAYLINNRDFSPVSRNGDYSILSGADKLNILRYSNLSQYYDNTNIINPKEDYYSFNKSLLDQVYENECILIGRAYYDKYGIPPLLNNIEIDNIAKYSTQIYKETEKRNSGLLYSLIYEHKGCKLKEVYNRNKLKNDIQIKIKSGNYNIESKVGFINNLINEDNLFFTTRKPKEVFGKAILLKLLKVKNLTNKYKEYQANLHKVYTSLSEEDKAVYTNSPLNIASFFGNPTYKNTLGFSRYCQTNFSSRTIALDEYIKTIYDDIFESISEVYSEEIVDNVASFFIQLNRFIPESYLLSLNTQEKVVKYKNTTRSRVKAYHYNSNFNLEAINVNVKYNSNLGTYESRLETSNNIVFTKLDEFLFVSYGLWVGKLLGQSIGNSISLYSLYYFPDDLDGLLKFESSYADNNVAMFKKWFGTHTTKLYLSVLFNKRNEEKGIEFDFYKNLFDSNLNFYKRLNESNTRIKSLLNYKEDPKSIYSIDHSLNVIFNIRVSDIQMSFVKDIQTHLDLDLSSVDNFFSFGEKILSLYSVDETLEILKKLIERENRIIDIAKSYISKIDNTPFLKHIINKPDSKVSPLTKHIKTFNQQIEYTNNLRTKTNRKNSKVRKDEKSNHIPF